MLPSLACGSPTLGSSGGSETLRFGLGAECWGLARGGDLDVLVRRVLLRLAVAEWRLPLKPDVSVEQEEDCCSAPLPSRLSLLQGVGSRYLSLGRCEASGGELSFPPWSLPALEDEVLTLLGALSAVCEAPGLTTFLSRLFPLEGSRTLFWPHPGSAAGLGLLGAGCLALGGASLWTSCLSPGPPRGLTLRSFDRWTERPMGSHPCRQRFSRALACAQRFELFVLGGLFL